MGNQKAFPYIIISASAQKATIFSTCFPTDDCGAHSGMTNPAISSITPFLMVCRKVTGMVAADDCVPNAVK